MPVTFPWTRPTMRLAASSLDSLSRQPLEQGESAATHVALVVVHGMGRQRRGETLLEWAEPLVTRINHLARQGEEPHSPAGVVIREVVLGGEGDARVVVDVTTPVAEASVTATATATPTTTTTTTATAGAAPAAASASSPGGTSGGPGYQTRRLRITEARWSESFLAMKNGEVFRWGALFLWKAVGRMLLHFSRTVFLAPVAELRTGMRARLPATQTAEGTAHEPPVAALVRRVWSALALGPVALLTGTIVVAGSLVVLVVGVLLTILLPLLSVLLLIPGVSAALSPLLDTLVEFVGDVGVWREKPLRAAAMRQVVHEEIVKARQSLTGDDPVLAVLAHSQGAAVSARVLFREYDHSATPRISSFTTVGAAVMLLGRTRWTTGSSSSFTPVAEWLSVEQRIRWDNYWAIWDPFSAGPIADSGRGRRVRWWLSYGATETHGMPGPSEHPVHNTAQPLTDHQSYARNTLQVVDPLARTLLGLPAGDAETARRLNRRHVQSVKARGVMSLCAVVLAAITVLGSESQRAAATAIQWLEDRVMAALALVSAVPDPVGKDVSFGALLGPEPGTLSMFGSICVAALIIAVGVAVGGWLRGRVRKGLEDGGEANATIAWIIGEACGRALLLILIVRLGVQQVIASPLEIVGECVSIVFIGAAAIAAFLSPFLARVPRSVPELRAPART